MKVVDPDGRAGKVLEEPRSRRTVGLEELHQRAWVPAGVAARMEKGALPPAPLRDTHHLSSVCKDLARPLPGEAHQCPMLTGYGAALVHDALLRPEGSERSQPPGAHPCCSCPDIFLPQRVGPGNPSLHPKMIAGLEEDGTPSPAAPNHFRARFGHLLHIEDVEALGAPENQGRVIDLSNHGMACGESPEWRDIEQRRGARMRIRSPGREIRHPPAVPQRPGRLRQEAAARYGSHNGSTSER